ncbi:MAG: redox-sensing transcriptional repressor Rex [Planctomycetota bacterium]
MPTSVPLPSVRRLPVYLDLLRQRATAGEETIACTAIAGALGQDPTQVRKDLAITGVGGRPKIGYDLAELIAGIESFLGWNDCSQAFLAGAGNLGRALVGYAALRDAGLEIACAFDTDPIKQAETIGQIQVLPLRRLRTLARRMHIHVGIIAVPAAAAQNVAELMIDGGITAIWNFAPQRLEVPPEVVVEDADMLSGFAVLSHRLQHRLHPVAGR